MDFNDWYELSKNWVRGDKAQKVDAPRPYGCSLGKISVDLDEKGNNMPRVAHLFDKKPKK